MSYNMTGEEYELLYKRYLTRSPKELLEIAGMKQGMSVLDLCCGSNGRASKAALEMGASYVCAVDSNLFTRDLITDKSDKLDVFIGTVYCLLNRIDDIDELKWLHGISDKFYGVQFDVVICQQAINYWLGRDNSCELRQLKKNMKTGAKFVFNTFNNCPSEEVNIKEYEIDGLKYVEVFNYYKEKSLICHLQSADGLRPHYTEFSWIPPELFREKLNMFDIEVKTDGNTDIYICTKIA